MKYKMRAKLVAIVMVVSVLLTNLGVPATAATSAKLTDSVSNIQINDSIADGEEMVIPDDLVLKADDQSMMEDSMVLQHIGAEKLGAANHTRRLTELEDLNTYVFENSNGTRTVYFMDENVKYIDENGKIKEKNISLVSKENGFGIAQSDIGLTIPHKLDVGIDLDYLGYAIKLTPQDIYATVTAEQKGNAVVYEGAFGAGTSLKYTPLLSGMKEDIILSAYTSDASYAFILETDGLNVYSNDEGYYLADPIKRDPVFYLGEIIIYDAVGKPDIGTMTVQTLQEGKAYLLTITADDDFLSDPTTVYPVTIDPSITISDNTTVGAIEDAPIYEGYPNGKFGAYVYNYVGTPSTEYGIGRTVVRLRGLIDSSEYRSLDADQIESVIFYATEATGGVTHTINLYPLTSNTTWTESTVTWNNIGSHTTALSTSATMFNGQESAFNITALV